MEHGSLFVGIGGFDLGFERAGMETAWQVETGKGCNRVLRRHWPNVARYKDVRECGKRNLGPVDVLSGGFPCQDLSVAGRRAGLAGERSGLWWEFHRIIAELNPAWVVIENVPGLLHGCGCVSCQAVARIVKIHARIRERQGGVKCPVCVAGKRMLKSHSGRNIAQVVQGLAQLGYGWAWRCFDAQYDGLAQRRKRVFIVGRSRDMGRLGGTPSKRDISGLAGLPAKVLFEPESLPGNPPPSRGAAEGITAPLKASSPGRRGGGSWPIAEEFIVQRALSAHNQRNDPDGETFIVLGFDRSRGTVSGEVAAPLRACGGRSPGVNDGKADNQCVAYNWQSGGDVRLSFGLPNLQANQVPAVGVRRLTPTECERLQGFPSGFTAWGISAGGQRVQISDTARYKMLGNAVWPPAAEWIGRRIVEIHDAGT